MTGELGGVDGPVLGETSAKAAARSVGRIDNDFERCQCAKSALGSVSKLASGEQQYD
jgi:hypothetical protein